MVAGCSAVRAARTACAKAQAPLSEVPTTYWATTRGDKASEARSACGTRPMFIRSLGSSPGIEVTNRSVIESRARAYSPPVSCQSEVSARWAAEANRSVSPIGESRPNSRFQSSGLVRPSSLRFG